MKNKYIFYGIIFYYLYIQVYSIVCKLLVWTVLIMQLNIYFIPVILSIVILIFSFWFYKIEHFPPIKIWFILFVVLTSITLNFLNFPERYYLQGGGSQ